MLKEVSDEIALVIECNQCLTTLELDGNDLQYSSLSVLSLQCSQLTEDAVEYISSIILNNTGMNELYLNENNNGKGVLHIDEALQNISSLKI